MGHVHVHAPHELSEPHEEHEVEGRERVLEFVAVLLLSLTTLLTAWSGYQAALWSGEQSKLYATGVGDAHPRPAAEHARGPAADRRPPLLQRLARTPRRPATRSWRPTTRGASGPSSSRLRAWRSAQNRRSPARCTCPSTSSPRTLTAKAIGPQGRRRLRGGHAGEVQRRPLHPVDGVLRRSALLRGHLAAAGLAAAADRRARPCRRHAASAAASSSQACRSPKPPPPGRRRPAAGGRRRTRRTAAG